VKVSGYLGPVTALVAPPAPSWDVLLTDWSLDVTLPVVVAVAATYVFGVRRFHARGRSWPATRTAAFLSGLAVVLVATDSGIAAYDRVLYSLHVVQHMLLGMVAPLLLVLGAPITLTLQGASRRTQRAVLRVLHGAPARVLTHPLTAWLLFGTSIVTLYFTPLYELSLRNEWFHVATHAYFVGAGCLFLAHVVGLDPIPHALGYGARLLYVVVLLPFHTFVGVALLSMNTVIASGWYAQVERSWGVSALADQRTGAGLLWISGELFGLLCIGIVVYQWMHAEERAGARHDRRLDLEAAASQSDG
jgi:putative membrane protein